MNPPASQFEDRLFLALLCLLLWLPLPLGSNRPWAVAIFVVWIGLLSLLGIVGWQRKRVTAGVAFRGARAALWLLAIWLAYVTLQLIPLPVMVRQWLSPESLAVYGMAGETGWAPLSLHPYATLQFWLKSAAYAALFALTLLLVNSKQRLVMLGYTLVFSAVFQAFYGSMMTLSGMEYGFFMKKTAYLGFATGTFVNRNHLAGYLEMASAVGIGLLMATSYQKDQVHSWRQRLRNLVNLLFSQKLPLRLMLATMVIALVLTRSRMGNTAFFASMLVTGVIALAVFRSQSASFAQMFRRSDTRSAVILIASLVVIDLFIVGAWFGVEKVAQRIAESSVSHDADRVDASLTTLALLNDYPLVGTGGGSFHLAYTRYRGEDIVAYYDHTHQDYLEIMADTGAVGIALLGLVVLTSLWAALKALYRRRDGLMRGMAFSSIMGIVALLIHSTVDFNLQIPANAATFMVILALGWIALHLDRRGIADSETGASQHG
ncbi:MAG TPA: O-antigen ligase family protein [Gallionella sp.]|nr:O-antigen ligase family protein [Gallionella sp.]